MEMSDSFGDAFTCAFFGLLKTKTETHTTKKNHSVLVISGEISAHTRKKMELSEDDVFRLSKLIKPWRL